MTVGWQSELRALILWILCGVSKNILIPVGVQDFELFHSDLEQSVDHQSRYRDMVLSSLQLSSSR